MVIPVVQPNGSRRGLRFGHRSGHRLLHGLPWRTLAGTGEEVESFRVILKIIKEDTSLLMFFIFFYCGEMHVTRDGPCAASFHGFMVWSLFALSCRHPHRPSPGQFCLAKLSLCPPETPSPQSPLPQPLATTVLFSVPMNATAPVSSRRWNHAVSVLL